MERSLAFSYYSRAEVQRAILRFSYGREIGVMFDGFFGKRPEIIDYLSDLRSFVKQGAFSFHMSEERWENPLLLGNNLSDEDKNKNRNGWDLILDLDGLSFEYSKVLAKVIVDYLLDELGLRNVSVKFSGNKGFHIGIPFEAFSRDCTGLVEGVRETRLLFPEIAKKTALFLLSELRDKISLALLDYEGGVEKGIYEICRKHGFTQQELEYNDEKKVFNFMKLIEIDTILITSRHLFRMPYSLNEKSGLVSIPVCVERIMGFGKNEALPENVNPEKYEDFEFLFYNEDFGKDGNKLLQKVYGERDEGDYEEIARRCKKEIRGLEKGIIFTGDGSGEFFEIEGEVKIADFPETINYVLNNGFSDGRKRALFLLLTFLFSVKWRADVIRSVVLEWNGKLDEPLKENYVNAQFGWFENQERVISPPNFSNANYYADIDIPCEIVDLDRKRFRGVEVRNPLHYVYLLLKRSKIKENGKK